MEPGRAAESGPVLCSACFGLGGLAAYHCICRRWQQRRVFARRLLAGVLAFSCLFGIVHIGIGKFGQWNTDSDLVEQYINALALKEDLPGGGLAH